MDDRGSERVKELAKDPTISAVIRYTQEGWPQKKASTEKAEEFRKVADFFICRAWMFAIWN